MKKILVIDDEKDMLFMIQYILKTRGYKVQTDDSGNVFEIIKYNGPPDLILLDINIGEKDGGQICLELKTDERTKNIPIILVSAEKNIEPVKNKCGAEDYLPKPFTFEDLLSKVDYNLKST